MTTKIFLLIISLFILIVGCSASQSVYIAEGSICDKFTDENIIFRNSQINLVNKIRDPLYEEGSEWELSKKLTIYLTRPISNDMVLPYTTLSRTLISNKIYLEGCPGEYKPATFIVYTLDDVSDLTFNVSSLNGTAGTIPASAVDIRVVKCWYQDSGDSKGGVGASGNKMLIPELLCKDDGLVKVENGENYLRMTDGSYRWISDPTKKTGYTTPTSLEFPVQDSVTLLPVNILSGENKQFWVLVKIPETANSGTYIGNIYMSDNCGERIKIQLHLDVLPFTLSSPILEYDLYYFGESGTAYPNGSISHQFKSDQQMLAEFKNMVDHGIFNVSFGAYGHDIRDWYNLGKLLTTKNAVGMTNRPLYYNFLGDDNYEGGLNWKTNDPAERNAIIKATQDVINFTRLYGVTSVYAYGLDEKYDEIEILKYKQNFEAVHEAGGKVYIAGASLGNYYSLLGSTVDLFNNHGKPDSQEAKKWHSIGSRIFCYGNPQVGVEKPETYRKNFGLLLWQSDYDGAMNFAYQSGAGDIWNDFDSTKYKDHVFTYPTVDGVIDTLAWEGWREAITDVRYLSTLLDVMQKIKSKGGNINSAEAWVTALKASSLENVDLDLIRSEIINQILSLPDLPPILNSIGNKSVTVGQLLQFSISATDPNNNLLNFSASNLPSGASFNAKTRTFNWTPTIGQIGTHRNIHFQVSDGNNNDYEDITITVIASIKQLTIVLIILGAIVSIFTLMFVYLKRKREGFNRRM